MKKINMEKKIYRIPVSWECCGILEVEATNLSEAIKMVKADTDADGNDFALPEGDYVDGSFRISKGYTKGDIQNLFNIR